VSDFWVRLLIVSFAFLLGAANGWYWGFVLQLSKLRRDIHTLETRGRPAANTSLEIPPGGLEAFILQGVYYTHLQDGDGDAIPGYIGFLPVFSSYAMAQAFNEEFSPANNQNIVETTLTR
jgi:hypothetical protein